MYKTKAKIEKLYQVNTNRLESISAILLCPQYH